MFSGKSEELIRRLKRARRQATIVCFKPELDIRYHRTPRLATSALDGHGADVDRLREAVFAVLDAVEVIGNRRGTVL